MPGPGEMKEAEDAINFDTIFNDDNLKLTLEERPDVLEAVKAKIEELGEEKYEIFTRHIEFFNEDWYIELNAAKLIAQAEGLSKSNRKEDIRKAMACFGLALLSDSYHFIKYKDHLKNVEAAKGEEKAGAAAGTALATRGSTALMATNNLGAMSALDLDNLMSALQSAQSVAEIPQAVSDQQKALQQPQARWTRAYQALYGKANCLVRLGKIKSAIAFLGGVARDDLSFGEAAPEGGVFESEICYAGDQKRVFKVLKDVVLARVIQASNGIFFAPEATKNTELLSEAWKKIIDAKHQITNNAEIHIPGVMAAAKSLEAFLTLLLLTIHCNKPVDSEEAYMFPYQEEKAGLKEMYGEDYQPADEERAYTQSEHLQRAEKLYSDAKDLDANSWAPKLGLALIAMTKGNYQDAKQKLEQALRAAQGIPDKLELYRQLASLCVARKKDWDLATKALDICFAIQPEYPPAVELNINIKYEAEAKEDAMSTREKGEQASAEELVALEQEFLALIASKQPALRQDTEEKTEAVGSEIVHPRSPTAVAPKAAMWAEAPVADGRAAAPVPVTQAALAEVPRVALK